MALIILGLAGVAAVAALIGIILVSLFVGACVALLLACCFCPVAVKVWRNRKTCKKRTPRPTNEKDCAEMIKLREC
ncbi:hypothetical protein I4U23_011959 [Adineta vaga]|nr:hypothetical protein I4U23_011959 [Adineta vaga]